MEIIYLDNAATTKPNKEFFDEAIKIASECYYNPSAKYKGGRDASEIVSSMREKVLSAFHGKALMFTSCGTEADNTAIFGFIKKGNGVTTIGEHSAVYGCFEKIKAHLGDVRYAPLDKSGRVQVDKLLELVDDKTSIVSVMHVNNETGAVNDINYIASEVKRKNPDVIFHSDGVQAFGKIPYVMSKDVDLYSLSAHKIGAIKGIGALIYNPKLHIEPYIIGGGQENGLRSGTENVLGIANFGLNAESSIQNIEKNFNNALSCKNAFLSALNSNIIKTISDNDCSPYIVSIYASGLRGEVILRELQDEGIYVGTGSACSSKNPHSRIIKACGYDKNALDGVLRISFGYNSTIEEAEKCGIAISKIAASQYKVMNKR